MTESVTAGEFTVVTVEDGVSNLPPSAYPGAAMTGAREIPIGAHLVRGPHGLVLIDAGAGVAEFPFPPEMAEGLADPPAFLLRSGRLPQSLAELGVDPADITDVLLTHLHLDHVGWLAVDGEPYFPNATVRFGAADWAPFVTGADPADPARAVLEAAAKAGVLRPYDDGESEILPGIRAVPTPGHTPGSHVLVVGPTDEQVWFTGDLITHPGQLVDADIHFMMDTDRPTARRARATVFDRARHENIVIAAAHLASPAFRRISAAGEWAFSKSAP